MIAPKIPVINEEQPIKSTSPDEGKGSEHTTDAVVSSAIVVEGVEAWMNESREEQAIESTIPDEGKDPERTTDAGVSSAVAAEAWIDENREGNVKDIGS
ncbi:hypothetical protein HK102_003330 [Quaeritorhiza haematococci]|nr:hypothetical protein HK102_003330 [Quaeritorhiza haematococci]